MSDLILPVRSVAELTAEASMSLDDTTLAATQAILEDVRVGGDDALRRRITQFEDRPAEILLFGREALEAAYGRLDPAVQGLLARTADRIGLFARGQMASLHAFEMPIPGGIAGHQIAPVERAACYAPGGRFPLPSSVLMTAVTARAAGVKTVLVVSPSTDDVMLGAAFVAGADQFLWAGGAHAIGAERVTRGDAGSHTDTLPHLSHPHLHVHDWEAPAF